DHSIRRRLVLSDLPIARIGVRRLVANAVVAENSQLLLAPGTACHLDGPGGFCDDHLADKKLIPRRAAQAIRAHRAGQGLLAAPRALWPCFPQCHAIGYCWLPGRVRISVFCRLAVDRNDLLA